MLRILPLFALTATLMAACSDFPQLDESVTPTARNAEYPRLMPIDQIISGAKDVQITEATISTLNGHIARLRGRASRLSRPVIDAGTRARLQAAISRHN